MSGYLAPLIGVVVAALLLVAGLLLIRRPKRPPDYQPSVPAGTRIVVVGGGFGGLQAVNKLRKLPVEVTLIDRRNFHLFQPLVYQVATGALSPGEIAAPLRSIFKRSRNVRVLLGEVGEVDLERRVLHVQPPIEDMQRHEVPYDTLIVAAGSKYSYFGHDEWVEHAPEVKSLESALDVRRRVLQAFEAAELEEDPERRASWLTFAVVGAGPTGAEMAGQIAELARDALPRDFRAVDTAGGQILLVEGGPRILMGFPPDLSESAERQLDHLGVTTLVDSLVVGDRRRGRRARVAGRRAPARRRRAPSCGRRASPPRASPAGWPRPRARRSTAPGASRSSPTSRSRATRRCSRSATWRACAAPRTARSRTCRASRPVAMQQGRYAADVVKRRIADKPVKPFKYIDKGNLATIGRARAVADIKGVHFGGALAWLLWLGIHIFYLIGFQNRLLVLMRWSFSLPHPRARRAPDHGGGSTRARTGFHTPRVEAATLGGRGPPGIID